MPGGSFQALLQPIENPLECTGYRDQLRGGLRQDCRKRKTYDMPMGGAKGALWTPQWSAHAHLECICTSSIFNTHTNRYTQIHTHTISYIHICIAHEIHAHTYDMDCPTPKSKCMYVHVFACIFVCIFNIFVCILYVCVYIVCMLCISTD